MMPSVTVGTVMSTLDAVLAAGYRVFNVEPNYNGDASRIVEIAFIKVHADGTINTGKGVQGH